MKFIVQIVTALVLGIASSYLVCWIASTAVSPATKGMALLDHRSVIGTMAVIYSVFLWRYMTFKTTDLTKTKNIVWCLVISCCPPLMTGIWWLTTGGLFSEIAEDASSNTLPNVIASFVLAVLYCLVYPIYAVLWSMYYLIPIGIAMCFIGRNIVNILEGRHVAVSP